MQQLGDRIGYGNLMVRASKIWRNFVGGGAFAVGPCIGLTEPCGCGSGCDWCAGSGWLTAKVKALKVASEGPVQAAALNDLDALLAMLGRMDSSIVRRTKVDVAGCVWDTLYFADPVEHIDTPDQVLSATCRFLEFCDGSLASI